MVLIALVVFDIARRIVSDTIVHSCMAVPMCHS